MTRLEFTVQLEEGLHTRPASLLAEIFADSSGKLIVGDRQASLSSMLSLMTLGVRKGESVIIETPDEIEDTIIDQIASILHG